MAYVFVFIEGIMAFISPCILPMFPVYVMYLAGKAGNDNGAGAGTGAGPGAVNGAGAGAGTGAGAGA
ncbi:MAG: cytochrome c biogenesis protein CcdA, partial [Oscillospiraceae bacterium]|nr:cytochrome c biogenesis protein CcdA [Oscillospiraceae bacterium]